MTPTQPIALDIQGAQVVYPNGHVAVRPTDLSLRSGEFVVLLGASGAGKSTLLRALNGLVPLSGGMLVSLQQGPIRDRRALRTHRKATGMIFQQHQLIGRLPALDNVLTGRLAYHSSLRSIFPLPKADRLIALQALERVGLLDCALKRVDQLSGGQQQRVGIARALAQRPRIMLADEPVASLDAANAQRVLSLIHSICKADGIAALVSLHQVDLARRYADRVIGIRAGSLVFAGPAERLDALALERIYGGSAHASLVSAQPDSVDSLNQPKAALAA